MFKKKPKAVPPPSYSSRSAAASRAAQPPACATPSAAGARTYDVSSRGAESGTRMVRLCLSVCGSKKPPAV